MKLKAFIICAIGIVLLTTFSNCKKDSDRYTVKGRLLKSCDDPTPVPYAEIYLYNDYKSTAQTCNSGEIARGTTNENGEFELGYNRACADGIVGLGYDISFSTAYVAVAMKSNRDYDLGDIYKKDNGFYLFKIKTNHPYTDKDTLFYNITPILLDSTYKFIVGPFTDGQAVDSFKTTVSKIVNPTQDSRSLQTYWRLKSGKNDYKFNRFFEFYIEPCKKYSEGIIDISK